MTEMQHIMEDMSIAVQALQRQKFTDAYMEILECNHGDGDRGGLEEQLHEAFWELTGFGFIGTPKLSEWEAGAIPGWVTTLGSCFVSSQKQNRAGWNSEVKRVGGWSNPRMGDHPGKLLRELPETKPCGLEDEIVGDPMILEQETKEQQVLPPENTNENQPIEQNHEQMDIESGRSQRPRKRALADDYYVYLQESKHDVNAIEDHMNYMQAMSNEKSENWWGASVGTSEPATKLQTYRLQMGFQNQEKP
ncbi:hypothetical protein L3X38_037387 [Prunus dulcis]|uniref:Uncharacterized protein n=1 Tax=Prunus dulcis TaxID=3755 RepID=A0AAD4YQL1_PRUDU|nr:hypothetical protein L3X38_037387 [Prunus dulcis]